MRQPGAHDLKNLHGIILSNSELLITSDPPLEEVHSKKVQAIWRAASRANEIVEMMSPKSEFIVALPTIELVSMFGLIIRELRCRAGAM
jgi:hypothetical protein